MVLVSPCITVSSSGDGADRSAATSIYVPADSISHPVASTVLCLVASILLLDMFAMRGVASFLICFFFVEVLSCFSSQTLSAPDISFLAFVSQSSLRSSFRQWWCHSHGAVKGWTIPSDTPQPSTIVVTNGHGAGKCPPLCGAVAMTPPLPEA